MDHDPKPLKDTRLSFPTASLAVNDTGKAIVLSLSGNGSSLSFLSCPLGRWVFANQFDGCLDYIVLANGGDPRRIKYPGNLAKPLSRRP
jgi:hypothetical protein